MGTKTLLLAIAYASFFKWQAVLPGVYAANASNHLFAVFIGNYLPSFVLTQYIRMTAAALFITLRIWTIKVDKLKEQYKPLKLNIFWAVTIAFSLRRWLINHEMTRHHAEPSSKPSSRGGSELQQVDDNGCCRHNRMELSHIQKIPK